MERVTAMLRHLASFLAGWRVLVIAAALAVVILAGATLGGESALTRGLVLGVVALVAMIVPVSFLAAEVRRAQARNERLVTRVHSTERRNSDLGSALRVLDGVVADLGRRPLDPTTLPWSPPELPTILLLPGASYHLAEIVPLAERLEAKGFATRIASGADHWARTWAGAAWLGRMPLFAAPAPEDLANISAVVTMKDWAGYGLIVDAANAAGIPTFAKVEGAQDFGDVDTGQDRRPYRSASHILCQGRNDYDALEGSRTVVGSTRLERLWQAPPTVGDRPLAVINLNFTYGVLTEARRTWLDTAVAGCEAAGTPYVIAVHPAERSRAPHPLATAVPISRLLERASALISRFSTVPFEAMARGVPFIYHNPHGERVPTFADPSGAFDVTGTPDEVAEALFALDGDPLSVRKRCAEFFLRQVEVAPATPSEERSARVIGESLPPPG